MSLRYCLSIGILAIGYIYLIGLPGKLDVTSPNYANAGSLDHLGVDDDTGPGYGYKQPPPTPEQNEEGSEKTKETKEEGYERTHETAEEGNEKTHETTEENNEKGIH